MLNTDRISAVILVKNGQDTIGQCLEALAPFNEIIVLDNGSTDKTVEIAKKYPNAVIHSEPDFKGFGNMKNIAVGKAKNDWILSIDADEVLLKTTVEKINSINLDDDTVVALSRLNFYGKTCIKACGWYPDYVWRIFNRKHTKFNENLVHEGIIVSKSDKKVYIKDALNHYTNTNIHALIEKRNQYSTLSAEEKFARGEKSSTMKAVFKFFFTFNKEYFFRKGIFYGYKGFALSFISAWYVCCKYLKLKELNDNKK
ncbi:MAG: glycosyltransferase family 2 protein [Bacteroidales bacterium]|nr:glycosyltransferase family 2 protein [Bacteroidales bacterium]